MNYEEVRERLRGVRSVPEAKAALAAADRWAADHPNDPRRIDLEMAVHVVAQALEDNRA